MGLKKIGEATAPRSFGTGGAKITPKNNVSNTLNNVQSTYKPSYQKKSAFDRLFDLANEVAATSMPKSAPKFALPTTASGIVRKANSDQFKTDPLDADKALSQKNLEETRKNMRLASARANVARRSGYAVNGIDLQQEQNKLSDLRKQAQGYQKDIDRVDYVQHFQDIKQDDDFFGQFWASYDMGRLGQDEALAWNDYLNNPTPQNRRYAEAVSEQAVLYQQRNQEALDNDAILPWITQDLARYIPQFIDQNIAGLKGLAGGAATGTIIPGIGTAVGGKIGYVAGRAAYGYDTMRGIAFKSLLDAGVDEETARAAANDEAFISSLIEGGDAAVDLLTLGGGKLIGSVFKQGAKTGAQVTKPMWKKILSGGAALLGNAAGEGAQEWTQEGVSLANQKREGSGLLDLVGATGGQIYDALSGQDPDALAQMNEAGAAGFRIGLMMGGGTKIANTALAAALNRSDQNQSGNVTLEQMADEIASDWANQTFGSYQDDSISFSQPTEQIQTQQEVPLLDRLRQQTSTLSNRQAEQVLSDRDAVATLQQKAGLDLSAQDTLAKRRAAVKQSFEQYAARQQQAQADQNRADMMNSLGENGKKAFVSAVRQTGDADATYPEFARAYAAGLSGSDQTADLSPAAQSAYYAGQNDAATRAEVKAPTMTAGFTESEYSGDLSESDRAFYDVLGKATGTKITVTAPTGANGKAVLEDLISINPVLEIRAGEPEVDQMVNPAGVKTAQQDQWTTTRVGDENVTPKTLSEIFEDVRHSFGINITTGHVRGAGVKGTYNRRTEGIRTKIANDLPTLSHEIGHHLDNMYGLTDNLRGDALSELVNNMSDDMRAAYAKKKWKTEGLAEFVRRFMQNRETAAIDYPEFTKYFIGTLSGSDAAMVYQLADEINAYYALGAQSASGNIRFREERRPDARTLSEKISDKAGSLYQAWVDANHGIKRFDEAAGTSVYKLASNSAYSDAMAANIIVHDLRDMNGNYVGPGLSTVLSGINLNSKEEYRAFGEYLVVKHGPERLKEGMRVFADDRQNSTAWMEARQAELEEQYPEFKAASGRLYEFQRQLLQTWGVNTGLVSQKSADEWGERWKYYVPFNRAMEDKKSSISARRGFANQTSTIKRAKGSGRDIVHPVDNIINNMVAMVNAGARNNVMQKITGAAMSKGGLATFIEKVPAPIQQKKFDAKGLKKNLSNAVEESDLSVDDKDAMNEIISNIDDILIQYGRGKAFGDVVTVMNGGKPEFWKINDPLLLQSITSMNQSKMDGVLDAYAVVSRFITGNITGKNLLWSIFSNAPRDIMTFFTYSKDKNPLHVFGSMGSAYVNKLKGSGMDPLYAEYLAMGGGQTSVYTADRDLSKKARKRMAGSKADWLNPMEWIAFTSDMIETGPRFATYKMMRQKGMNPQDSFYEAMDITVNFRRGGRLARELNKVIPFFNASVQGLDKFSRWVRGTDAPRASRGKVIRTRMIGYIMASAALAAFFYGINNKDDEEEEDYQQLSNFTKNSYWLVPLGDGKYFAIPKPRELGVLSSFFETSMESLLGGNSRAFDEFYTYITDNAAPPVLSDLLKGDWQGAIGSLGIIGTGAYIMANRDFLGRPIESGGMMNLEPKDRYTDRTSMIAKEVGQAFNISPQKLDYFFNAVFGGFWKTQKALFPVGGENVDITLGIQNTYIKDNQYSTDLVNWMYDKAEKSAQKSNSDPANIDKAITKKMDSNMTSFYSRYYALSKNKHETTFSRSTRQVVLDMIREYQKADELGSLTAAQSVVYDVCRKKGSTKYLPSAVQSTIKDEDNVSHTLSDSQYVEYQTDYLRIYWEAVEGAYYEADGIEEKANAILSAKSLAEDLAKNRALKRIGVKAYDANTIDYGSLELGEIAYAKSMYQNTSSEKDSSGNSIPGSKQEKVIDFMNGMDLTDDEWNYLWDMFYTSDKNNPRR